MMANIKMIKAALDLLEYHETITGAIDGDVVSTLTNVPVDAMKAKRALPVEDDA
jgi:hypothetical protein